MKVNVVFISNGKKGNCIFFQFNLNSVYLQDKGQQQSWFLIVSLGFLCHINFLQVNGRKFNCLYVHIKNKNRGNVWMQQYVDHVRFHIQEIRCGPISVCLQDVTQRKPFTVLNTFARVVYVQNFLGYRSCQPNHYFIV